MSSIFISYCREDRAKINFIIEEIQQVSLKYWLDESGILPTADFNQSILDGLNSCGWFLLVLTPQSAASEYVKDELQWALSNRNGRIIPVMLEPCDPAAFHLRMLRVQYVDLTSIDDKRVSLLRQTLDTVRAAHAEESLPIDNRDLDTNLDLVSLLLTFIPRHHQKHLRNLLDPSDSAGHSYRGGRPVRHELRDLCNWGLLRRCPGVAIGEHVQSGQPFTLNEVVEFTNLGAHIAPHVR